MCAVLILVQCGQLQISQIWLSLFVLSVLAISPSQIPCIDPLLSSDQTACPTYVVPSMIWFDDLDISETQLNICSSSLSGILLACCHVEFQLLAIQVVSGLVWSVGYLVINKEANQLITSHCDLVSSILQAKCYLDFSKLTVSSYPAGSSK